MERPPPSTHAYLSHVAWYLKPHTAHPALRGQEQLCEDGPPHCSERTDHFKKCELLWFQYSATWTASHNRHSNGIFPEIRLRCS